MVLAWVVGVSIKLHFTDELLSDLVDWVFFVDFLLALDTFLLDVKT